MSKFAVFRGGCSPFDPEHKRARPFVLLRDAAGWSDVLFGCSSHQDGVWLSSGSQALPATGLGKACCFASNGLVRVRSESAWIRGARVIGTLKTDRDLRFSQGLAQMLATAQVAEFEAAEKPVAVPIGVPFARFLAYRVFRFPL
jgi:hypothetical protein